MAKAKDPVVQLSMCPDSQPTSDFSSCQYYDKAESDIECGFCKISGKYYRCIADPGRSIPLSYSTVSDFLTCHRLYYLKNVRGIRINNAYTSPALKMGKLFDSVLQKHYGTTIDIPAIINEYEISPRDVAKVKALYRAYKALEITMEPGYELQAKISGSLSFEFDRKAHPECPTYFLVTGYYDVKYPTYFIEQKLSGRPDNYLDINFVFSQVGLYFMADPTLDHCIMQPVRVPDLKSTGANKDEDDDTYSERCYQDILTRPSHYFLGWNRETRTYGKKYHRSEFSLDDISYRLSHVFREIHQAHLYNGWYKNDRVCNNVLPGITCEYAPICHNADHMNEDMYSIRKHEITF